VTVAATTRCSVAGHEIAYVRAGTGPPVVLLHGIATYSFIWHDVMRRLSESYDAIAIDLLGCGASDKPLNVSYGLSAHADRLPAILAALGVDRVHLVGHDLGGGIAQIAAVRYPALIDTLTLVNSVGYDFWPVQPITAVRAPLVRHLLMASLDIGGMRLLVRRGLFFADRATPALVDTFHHPLRTPAGRKAFLHFARCLDNQDLMGIVPALCALTIPTLIVRGDADRYLSPLIADRLARDIPRSRVARIASAGHFLQIDEPAWLADTIGRFLGEPRDER